MNLMNRAIVMALSIFVVISLAAMGHACSRILWNTNGYGVLVGRNMDWFEDIRSNLWVLPRGMERDGLTDLNPLKWKSKFGSVILTTYDVGTADGINEMGLAGHLLYLPETSVAPRDKAVPGLSMSLWVQYYLDNFATVEDAVRATRENPYQLQMAVEPTSGKPATVHIALNDATGDSAIMECIDGELIIYHDRSYTVMTNQPRFEQQLENLKRYRGFGGDQRLPGTHEPADRFVRGAYYVSHLPEPKSQREAVAALMSVMRNVSAPFGIADAERPNVSTTVWRTVVDLSNRVMFYDSVLSPQVFWIDLKKVDFNEGQPVRKLTLVDSYGHHGDMSGQTHPAEMFEFLRPN